MAKGLGTFKVTTDGQFDKLLEAAAKYGSGSGRIIDDVLWNEGAKLISDEITRLLPVSGRTWRGKKKTAKNAQPFTQENSSLAVTVKSKPAYHYLYFPDDGTNTKRHKGEQYFMQRGADNVTEEIIDRCVNRLIKEWESGLT